MIANKIVVLPQIFSQICLPKDGSQGSKINCTKYEQQMIFQLLYSVPNICLSFECYTQILIILSYEANYFRPI